MADEQATYIQQCLFRLRQGDKNAREELIKTACARLTELTRAMFKSYTRLRRWEETGDVLQNALIRLHRALGAIAPETPRDFYRLATAQIRRELIDLARHHYGPEGAAMQHESAQPAKEMDTSGQSSSDDGSNTFEPSRLAVWTDFHRQVQGLPDAEREVFDLIWYQNLKQNEAAQMLGVSARTVLRRWQSACFTLHEAMRGIVPGP